MTAELRQAEVEERGARPGEHDVGGLQVAVDDAALVGGVEALGDLHGDLERRGERQGAAEDPLGERLALQVLHDQEGRAVVLADVEQGADARVGERRQGARLALEARPAVGVRGQGGRQHLDGDGAVETGIPGAIDLAHPARADGARDLVRPEPHSRSQ